LSVVRNALSRFEAWLNQPDQFEWVTKFLRQRGLLRAARMLMAIVTASSALTPISALCHLSHPPVAALVVGAVAVGVSGSMTYIWLTRWPTRAQSLIATVVGALCVVGWSLVQPRPAIGALACVALAITGSYIAFFHNTRVLLFNMTLALGITAVAVYRLGELADWPTAAAAFWIIWLLNLAVPMAVRGMSQAMAEYAMRAEQDALTGLLNRRGFTDALSGQLSAGLPGGAGGPMSLLMVDLDNFKRVNDTHGHLAGDQALRHVAELLRRHLPATAAICRAGGEEFLAAFTSASADAATVAARLCTAIQESGRAITASVGVATAEYRHARGASDSDFIDGLVAAADSAMYTAKRNGGNRVEHA
jgi:diguanylate cyclase (GGDEF)-like protein